MPPGDKCVRQLVSEEAGVEGCRREQSEEPVGRAGESRCGGRKQDHGQAPGDQEEDREQAPVGPDSDAADPTEVKTLIHVGHD